MVSLSCGCMCLLIRRHLCILIHLSILWSTAGRCETFDKLWSVYFAISFKVSKAPFEPLRRWDYYPLCPTKKNGQFILLTWILTNRWIMNIDLETQTTFGVDGGIWTWATLVEGECSHHCFPLAPNSISLWIIDLVRFTNTRNGGLIFNALVNWEIRGWTHKSTGDVVLKSYTSAKRCGNCQESSGWKVWREG